MTRLVLVAFVGLAAGYLAGQLHENTAPAMSPGATPVPVAAPSSARPVLCRATLAPEDVALLKRELVAAVTPGQDRAAPATPKVEEPPEDPARASAAAARVQDLLDRAIASGVWRDADAEALGSLLGELAPEDQRLAIATLTGAINQQRLKLRTSGAPF